MERESRNQRENSTFIEEEKSASIEEHVLMTQSNADTAITLKAYGRSMVQIQKFLGRKVHSMEIFLSGDVRQEAVVPVTMDELLNFIETKKRSRKKGITDTTCQAIKSAVKKFRQRNGFANFSDHDQNKFSRYIKGLKNQRSERVRAGELSGEEGKRHMKREEYESLARLCLERYEILGSKKFGTEVLLLLTITPRLIVVERLLCSRHRVARSSFQRNLSTLCYGYS